MLVLVHNVLAYLKYARLYKLTYTLQSAGGICEILSNKYAYNSSVPTGFCDSEFRVRQADDDRIEKRSFNFCVIMFNNAAIDWRISVTKRVQLSAPEAELCALSRLCQLLVSCSRIFKELGVDSSTFYPLPAFSDSKGAIAQGNHQVSDSKLIHVDNREFFCREQKDLGHVKFSWVSRAYNCADIGTHIITDPVAFERFTAFLLNTGPILWSRSLLKD